MQSLDMMSTLQTLLDTRFPQAVLLVGGSDAMRGTLAQHVAKALLCTGAKSPCGLCNACHKLDAHIHPDFIVIDEGDGEIKVDTARTIRSEAIVLPNDGARKVFVIHNANRLNPIAQNALLKTLEEPPSYAFFVLLCAQPDGLLETVRSRCTTFLLSPDTQSTPEIDELHSEFVRDFISALAAADEYAMLRAAMRLEKQDKSSFRAALSLLQIALRDAILSIQSTPLLADFSHETSALGAKLSASKLLALYDHCTLLLSRTQVNAITSVQCTVLTAAAYTICYCEI